MFLMLAKEKIQPAFLLLNFLSFQKVTKLNDFKRCKKIGNEKQGSRDLGLGSKKRLK